MLALQQSGIYKRHRPETTLLYQLVERYYPEFNANLVDQGKYLPKYVKREFEEFLRCGRLEHGLSITDHGKIRYELKTPYRDGTTHVFFHPTDFIGKLAALIPPPRLNLTRFR